MRNRYFASLLKVLPSLLLLTPVTLYAESLRVVGSTTIYPLVKNIAAAYMAENPGDDITVSGGGSDVGIHALIDGKVDIAASSRYLNDNELNLAAKMGVHLVPFRIANDCIIPVVNRSNRVKDLSISQLRDIYTGKVANWRVFGGDDLAIDAVSRRASSGTYDVWNNIILRRAPQGKHVAMLASNHGVVAAVSTNRGAIGYIALGYLNASVKPLSINGAYGSRQKAMNGQYSLSRPLFLFTRGWPQKAALNFITYALAPNKGQKIVDITGYVPLY